MQIFPDNTTVIINVIAIMFGLFFFFLAIFGTGNSTETQIHQAVLAMIFFYIGIGGNRHIAMKNAQQKHQYRH